MSDFDDILNYTPNAEQGGQMSKEDYAVKKQDERAALFELADNTALEVVSFGDTFRQYLDVQSTFDRYGTVNTLLILAQKPESTRIGDYEHWQAQGGYVKPGQSALSIIEPHQYTKEDGTPGTGYNIKKVFDISQVDARNIKTPPAPSYTDRQLLRALVKTSPVPVVGVDTLPEEAGAMYIGDNRIDVRTGMGFDDTFRSLSREICNVTAEHGDITYDNPQFTTYCSSYILCQKFGVDTQGYDFTESPKVFEGMDAREVKDELSKIRDAAASIAGRMARNLDAEKRKETKVRDEAR